MQTYFDFVAPCKAAGAVQNKRGDWHMPGETAAYCAAQFLREHDLEPLRIDPPKGRSMAAIRKAHTGRAEGTPGDRDWQAMRAVQYMLALRGAETDYQSGRWSHAPNVRFAKAPDGSRRVRYVLTDFDRNWVEVPNWDFVATVVETTLSELPNAAVRNVQAAAA